MAIAPTEIETPPEARSEDYLWTLNFGPQHPATHTTLRLVLKLEGERVVDAVPEMGYLHSGFEKIGEHLTFNQYVTVTDRMRHFLESTSRHVVPIFAPLLPNWRGSAITCCRTGQLDLIQGHLLTSFMPSISVK
jgi:hypothetical protein